MTPTPRRRRVTREWMAGVRMHPSMAWDAGWTVRAFSSKTRAAEWLQDWRRWDMAADYFGPVLVPTTKRGRGKG